MTYNTEIVEDEGPVLIGSTGTTGSLLCRKLESICRMEQKKKKKISWAPWKDTVSISCGHPVVPGRFLARHTKRDGFKLEALVFQGLHYTLFIRRQGGGCGGKAEEI